MYVIDYLLGRSPTTAQAQTWPVGEPHHAMSQTESSNFGRSNKTMRQYGNQIRGGMLVFMYVYGLWSCGQWN